MNVCMNHLIGLIIIFIVTLLALVVSINNRDREDD